MCQPRKWLWGLLPLFVLAILAGYWHQAEIERDLAKSGAAVLANGGFAWSKVEVSGRDAILTGEAPSPDAKALALKAAEAVAGVRRASDATTLLAEAKPFTLTALRDGAKITLSGYVPNAAARGLLAEAAKKAVPGLVLVDETKVARGAPESFGALASYGLTQLARLSQGSLSLSDTVLSLSGRATDFDQFSAVRSALSALPAGARLAKGLGSGDILPPLVKPFTFEAVRGPSGLELTGYVPTPEARQKILADLKSAGIPVKDMLRVADGVPQGDWTGAIGLGIKELLRLESGKLTASDDKLSLSGKAPEGLVVDALRAAFKGLPQGFGLAALGVDERAPPPPFSFEALRGENSLTLTGLVGDEKSRGELLDAARRLFEGDQINDKLAIGPVPRDAFSSMMGGLQLLSRLAPGSGFSIKGQGVGLKGLALFDAARDQIAADFRKLVPGGFSGSAELGTAQIGAQVGTTECQSLFRGILSVGTIRFQVASAQLSHESRGILDKLAIVALRCGDAKVEVGGHTDADGSPDANAELSRRRAEAVALYFTQAGIPAARLEPVGFGETQPVAPNDSPANKARNRRIEFVVK